MMEEQKKITEMGGTMRLGSYPCEIKEGSLELQGYTKQVIYPNVTVTGTNLTMRFTCTI